ncbi:glycerophosphodiester phosphodiesterase family protein [Hymenobacter sp. CRA2]|uniref:glycerophosphodiester phosphodiesterase family protein n=1 Tax=Hymenobacter sp. CRA2 TaxID=1955620 RepID=UPI00098F1FF4|nr:glycerophosphodiester phosphodiesterase family protein [Hymenobacter sp. CRA2]OON70953.1 hypothetical protein B0919_02830 [Hymenobacter sp. CRA2]
MSSINPPSRPLIYGHRGCRGLRPENTIPAFLHALEWGVDGLELDVVIAATGEVVVSHEPWLNADICTAPNGQVLTAAAGQAFNLYQTDYATIRRYDCGTRRHPRFPEQATEPAFKPLLSEVFAAVAARCSHLQRPLPAYSIELKSALGGDGIFHPSPAAFVTSVAQVIADAAGAGLAPSTVLLMSFDHRVVQAARQLTPHCVCLLIEDARALPEHIAQLGFLPDVVGPDFALLSEELRSYCRQHRLPIVTWTVNDKEALLRVAQSGVQGITTDYPNRAAEVFHH